MKLRPTDRDLLGPLRAIIVGAAALAVSHILMADQDVRVRPEADVRVTLVLLDTVVTDSKGTPIRGMAAGEFELLVDNKLVPMEAVEEFCAPPREIDETGGSGADPHRSEAGSGEGAVRSDSVHPDRSIHHYILFFDMSHLKVGARRKAIQIATQFVRERMGATDRAMILAFSRGLHLVSGFTSDREILAARLEKVQDDRALLDTTPFEQEVTLDRLAQGTGSPYGGPARRSTGLVRMGAMSILSNPECLAEARISEIETTRALRAIANTMPAFSALPGRKALMLFTETLQADPTQAYFNACGAGVFDRPSLGLTVAPEIVDLAHRANLAGVSFYPMHSGGMEAGRTGSVMEQAIAFQKSISLSTGGEAFIVMKNPLVAFEQAARDLSCYYMLAYRVDVELKPGRHTVVVRVSRKKVRVRHRESFVLLTHEEASDQQMLAVLSNPGLYRDLPVSAKGYTLADAGKGARHFLIQASVPRDDLVLLPVPPSGSGGKVHLRGGVISEGKLACEFSGTHGFQSGDDRPAPESGAGVQAICELPEGEYEVVVAGRDENGGALGTFWGRFPVRMDSDASTSGALLWAPASDGSWSRLSEAPWLPSADGSHEPLFIRHSLTLAPDEAGVLTFTACRTTGKPSTAAAALATASVTLRGSKTVKLGALPAKGNPEGRCELLRAEITPGSLPSGGYDVVPAVGAPWTPAGSPVRLRIH